MSAFLHFFLNVNFRRFLVLGRGKKNILKHFCICNKGEKQFSCEAQTFESPVRYLKTDYLNNIIMTINIYLFKEKHRINTKQKAVYFI
jgi:hypothetical protein